MTTIEHAPPIGRFVAIPNPVALPGCCTLCSGHKGPLIDTGLSHPGHGAITICFTCLAAMNDVAKLADSQIDLAYRRKIYARGYKDGIRKVVESVEKSVASALQSQLDLSSVLDEMVDNDDSRSVPDEPGDSPDLIISDSASTGAQVLLEGTGDDEGDIPESESVDIEVDSGSVVEGRNDLPSNPNDGQSLPALTL